MTISYNWLCEYLPEPVDPRALEAMLTSVGLEVESMENQKEAKDRLKGLLVGEVLSCEKHPGADKLKLTHVAVGNGEPLKIVCGAPNVAKGQKVVVAPPGTLLYPAGKEAFLIKKAKIRGEESEGMICAEDEIGLGNDHGGIMILPEESVPGSQFADIHYPETDIIFEIGLTPNRIDAMSHLGVARDICAYLSHHSGKKASVKSPLSGLAEPKGEKASPQVEIADSSGCRRYSGILIEGLTVKESPEWLSTRLRSIGIKPINNVVDVTNFVLHETGQPLHAFDFREITGEKVVVKTLPEGTAFTTLDGKERKLRQDDLMICNAQGPMCIAGVMGGLHSGVNSSTKSVFLESAWFDPVRIRRTSLHHGLRTDAAARFEKGCDISQTIPVLIRAALLICDVAGGEITGKLTDIYPAPAEKTIVELTPSYVAKLSGKDYDMATAGKILSDLGFEVTGSENKNIRVKVPFSKPDVHHPCDLVEEIMRIDGLDNIPIPSSISMSPAIETSLVKESAANKITGALVANGFYEIFTNSISNSAWYEEKKPVAMINSLSKELDILRPSVLESGLQAVAFNINRKNNNLRLFEFAKTYHIGESGEYLEKNHLAIWVTGLTTEKGWNSADKKTDYHYLKAVIRNVFLSIGLPEPAHTPPASPSLDSTLAISGRKVGRMGRVGTGHLRQMEIKNQEVWFADLDWDAIVAALSNEVIYNEVPRFPAMERDLALTVDRAVNYSQVEETVHNLHLTQLKSLHLFDIFESDKLGKDKKSVAVRFTFRDAEKTLTDEEVDAMMQKLILAFEKNIKAEIRK